MFWGLPLGQGSSGHGDSETDEFVNKVGRGSVWRNLADAFWDLKYQEHKHKIPAGRFGLIKIIIEAFIPTRHM